MTPRRAWPLLLAALVLLATLPVLLGLVPVKLNWLRGPITDYVQSEYGLQLELGGDLLARLGTRSQLFATDVSLGTTAMPALLAIDEVEAEVGLERLLQGHVHLPLVRGGELQGDVCDLDAIANAMPDDDEGESTEVSIELAEIRRFEMRCASQGLQAEDLPVLHSVIAEARLAEPVRIEAATGWRDWQAAAELTGPDLNALIEDPWGRPLRLALEIDDPGLSLTTSIDWRSERPLFVAEVTMPLLDLEEWPVEPEPESSPDPASPDAASADWDLDVLTLADLQLALRVDQLRSTEFESSDILLRSRLSAGALEVTLDQFHSDITSLTAALYLDPAPDCPEWRFEGALDQVDLSRLAVVAGLDFPLGGRVALAEFAARSCGRGPGEFMEGLDGTLRSRGIELAAEADEPMLAFEELNLEGGWRAPVQGGALLGFQGESAELSFRAGTLQQLVEENRSTLYGMLVAEPNRALVKGSLDFSGESPEAELDLALSLPELEKLLGPQAFEDASPPAVEFFSHLVVSGDEYRASGLEVSVGESRIAGVITLRDGSSRPALEAALHASLIDLDELVPLASALGEGADDQGESPADDEGPVAGVQPESNWPVTQFDLAIDKLELEDLQVADLSLRGQLSEGLLEIGQLALGSPSRRFAGTLVADFNLPSMPVSLAVSASELNLGELLAHYQVVEGVDAHAHSLGIRYESRGESLDVILANASLEVESQGLEVSLNDPLGDQPLPVMLQSLTARTRHGEGLVVSAVGEFDGVDLDAWLQLPPLRQLIEPGASLPLRLVLGGSEEMLMLDGSLESGSGAATSASLRLSGSQQRVPAAEFPGLAAPLNGFSVDAAFALGGAGPQRIELTALSGESRLAGSALISEVSERQRVDVQVSAPFIEVADFSQLISLFLDEDAESLDDAGEGGAPAPRPVAGAGSDPATASQSETGLLEWLDAYLDELTEHSDLSLTLAVDRLEADGELLGAAELGLATDNNGLQLDPFRIQLPEGMFDLRYSIWRTGDGVSAELDGQITQLEFGSLFQAMDPESELEGVLYLDAALQADARDRQSLPAALSGELSMAVFPRDMNAGLLNLWASNLLLALMTQGENDNSKINCLVSRFNVDAGVMNADLMHLDSTDIIVRGKGTIDLGALEVDLLAIPQAKRERFFSVASPVEVTGPLGDVQVGIAGGGMLQTLFRWYVAYIYVPWKWLTGERFPEDGTLSCIEALRWDPLDPKLDAVLRPQAP